MNRSIKRLDPQTGRSSVTENVKFSYRGLVVTRLYMTIAIGTFLLAIVIAVLGATLVYMGATGNTNMNILGATMATTNVGVACLFIAALTAIFIVRGLLKSAQALQAAPEQIASVSRRP